MRECKCECGEVFSLQESGVEILAFSEMRTMQESLLLQQRVSGALVKIVCFGLNLC